MCKTSGERLFLLARGRHANRDGARGVPDVTGRVGVADNSEKSLVPASEKRLKRDWIKWKVRILFLEYSC